MTDKELSTFGEKLYEGILVTPLPAGTIFAIATAIRQGVPWERLPPALKLAVFKIASHCLPEDEAAPDAAPADAQSSAPSPRGRDNHAGAEGETDEPATGGASEAIVPESGTDEASSIDPESREQR